MKAYTVFQPHATLIAIGVKSIETRGNRISYRGDMLIHAGKTLDISAYNAHAAVLAAHGYPTPESLPLGRFVAICRLADCRAMVKLDLMDAAEMYLRDADGEIEPVPERELQYGYYAAGRFAYMLEDVEDLTSIVRTLPEVRGQQGLWEYESKFDDFAAAGIRCRMNGRYWAKWHKDIDTASGKIKATKGEGEMYEPIIKGDETDQAEAQREDDGSFDREEEFPDRMDEAAIEEREQLGGYADEEEEGPEGLQCEYCGQTQITPPGVDLAGMKPRERREMAANLCNCSAARKAREDAEQEQEAVSNLENRKAENAEFTAFVEQDLLTFAKDNNLTRVAVTASNGNKGEVALVKKAYRVIVELQTIRG